MTRIWLASRSPRRRDLLTWAGFAVDPHPSGANEVLEPGEMPIAHAERLASLKARSAPNDRVVVAADSVVHRDGWIFGTPEDRAEARSHLIELSGRWHEVTTGVCVRHGAALEGFSVTTPVRFRALTEAEIDAYVATGDADDKAGAYGIQGRAGSFVAEIHGSWTNVMGLPLEQTLTALAKLGVQP
jgi:septum formation protein